MSRRLHQGQIPLFALGCCSVAGCFDEPPEAVRRSDSHLADAGTTAAPDHLLPQPTTPTASELGCRTSKVDLLFVIDNSGSMAEEQRKLARVLPQLVAVLATGNRDGKRRAQGVPTDFSPTTSMHIGVVSSDMGVNLATPAPDSCGSASFSPTAPNPSNNTVSTMPPSNGERLDKPFGDDGLMTSSTEVALAGISSRPPNSTLAMPLSVVVAPDPACAEVSLAKPYVEYQVGNVFEEQGLAFGCIAKLGRNGCGLEQQLEAMLKALTPSDGAPIFSRGSRGQGNPEGPNAGFLRDDSVLAIVQISDEEDCSIPDSASALFDMHSMVMPEDMNIRCGLGKYASLLQPTARYVNGLRALKPAEYRDRIIFTGIVGLPSSSDADGKLTYQGSDALSALLERPDMAFAPQQIPGTTVQVPTPVCVSAQDGAAAPARRFLEVAKAFGDNGIATSICEDDYRPAIDLLSASIAGHLGSCDP